MRAQGYDWVSVVWAHQWCSEKNSQSPPKGSLPIQCRAHVFNLCIVHASRIPLDILGYNSVSVIGFQRSACWPLRDNAAVREEIFYSASMSSLSIIILGPGGTLTPKKIFI